MTDTNRPDGELRPTAASSERSLTSNNTSSELSGLDATPAALLELLESAGLKIDGPEGSKIALVVQAMTQQTRGSYPPPAMLAEYKATDPRFVDEFLDAARSQRNHRFELEKLATESSQKRMDRAQSNAFWIALIGIVVSGVIAALAAYMNFPTIAWTAALVAAIAVGGSPVASIIVRMLPSEAKR